MSFQALSRSQRKKAKRRKAQNKRDTPSGASTSQSDVLSAHNIIINVGTTDTGREQVPIPQDPLQAVWKEDPVPTVHAGEGSQSVVQNVGGQHNEAVVEVGTPNMGIERVLMSQDPLQQGGPTVNAGDESRGQPHGAGSGATLNRNVRHSGMAGPLLHMLCDCKWYQ
jgi:hypothetical protein